MIYKIIAGATISKSINRICGTSLAGFLAIGVHWLASRAGDQLEPVIVGVSLFLLGIYIHKMKVMCTYKMYSIVIGTSFF